MQAQGVHQTLDEPVKACENLAYTALCQSRLGRTEEAHST
jgi:hypothetical protein